MSSDARGSHSRLRFENAVGLGLRWVLAAALGLAASDAAADEPQVLDAIAAVVNGDVVLWSDVRRAVERSPLLREALGQLPANATALDRNKKIREVETTELERLIDKQLVRSEAKRFQITVTDDDVARALPNVASSYGLSVDELKAQVEAGQEYGSWEEYRNELRDDILQYRASQLLAPYQVTDAQVREHYRKLTRGEQARVEVDRFVFTPRGTSSEGRDAAFAQAQAVARRLRAAEEPARVAASLAIEAPAVVAISRGEVAPHLEDAVFAAKVNEIVGPLASGQGYVVFRVKRHLQASALGFEATKERIRSELEQEAFIKAEGEFRRQLRSRAHIDIRTP